MAHIDRDARAARRAIAQDTVTFCRQGWYPSPADGSQVSLPMAEAVGTTQLYPHATLPPLSRKQAPATASTPQQLQVIRSGVIAVAEALTRNAPEERIGVLNFASARHPGGGFLKGANAQEECIVRCTGLYPCLASKQAAAFYANNSARAVRGIYTDAAIVSPSVPLFRHENGELLHSPRELCVVTCPAPNLGAVDDNAEAAAATAMRRRMVRVLHLFAVAGCETVVLGAWGCGVFKHDPTKIAAQWQQLLGTGGDFAGLFRRVIFAVHDSKTCAVFQRFFTSSGGTLDQLCTSTAAANTVASTMAMASGGMMEPEPEPAPASLPDSTSSWRPKNDPRLARVMELESQGDVESAARLLRVVLMSLDPEQIKSKLHNHLAKLEQQQHNGTKGGGAEAGLSDNVVGSDVDIDSGMSLARTRSQLALAEAAKERGRRKAALDVTASERQEHAELDVETRLLRQAIVVFNAGAQLAHSLEAAEFKRVFCPEQPFGSTPRGRGIHGQWFHVQKQIVIEIDPTLPGGMAIIVPWSRYADQLDSDTNQDTAEQDVAEWLELTLASDPTGSSFGGSFLRWLDDYIHLNSAMADPKAANGSESTRRIPQEGEIPALDVGLSRLPPPDHSLFGATEERALTIYTWGDALSTKAALRKLGSQLDVNAKPLNGRGGGANTRYNALQDTRIMRNVVSSMCEGTGLLVLKRTIQAIEADDLHTISVFCTKGRHRCEQGAYATHARAHACPFLLRETPFNAIR